MCRSCQTPGQRGPTGRWTRHRWPLLALPSLFGDRRVLDHLHLDIAPGEFVALIGRSGTGKSNPHLEEAYWFGEGVLPQIRRREAAAGSAKRPHLPASA